MNDWYEAEQRVERAQQLSESQQWDEALTEIDAALRIDPHHALWHAQRGFILEELNRGTEAVSAYERSLSLDPEDRDVTLSLGVALARMGRLSRASAILEDLCNKYPDYEPVYCQRISVYTELGQHELAEQMFYMAQELDDDCPHCYFHIADSLAVRGDMDRAIYCWERVLDLEPNYGGVHRRIAQAYRSRGELDKARECFLQELREDPGNTDLLFELGELAMEAKQPLLAAAKFAQIVELEEDHVEARFALAGVWLALGQSATALECLESVRKLVGKDPDLDGFRRRMGEALYHVGRHREAARWFAKEIKEHPGNVDLLMQRGTCLLAANNTKAAADCFRRVLAIANDHGLAHHSLGVCLFHEERYEDGLEHCREAIRLDPDLTSAMTNAAIGYIRLAQWRSARAMLQRAIKADPKNEHLQVLYRRIWRYRVRHALRIFATPIRFLLRRKTN